MVLSGFGQALTEKQIRRALGQSPAGLSLEKACQRIQRIGAQATWRDDWGLIDLRDCLRDGWFPIVGIERRFFGHADVLHAVVLLDISSQSARAFDPLGSAQAEIFNLQTFELAWISAGHQALVIKAPFPP
jgi:hypothetical protein